MATEFPIIPRPGIKFLERDGTVTLEWYRFLDNFLRAVTNPTGATGDDAITDTEASDLQTDDQATRDALLAALTNLEQDSISTQGGQTSIQWQDEGVNLGTSGTVDTVNITGGPITATRSTNTVSINVDVLNTGPPYTSLIYECWGSGGGAGASAFPFGAGLAVPSGGTFQIQEPTPNTTNIWDIFWRARSPGTGVGSVTGFSLIRALTNRTYWRGNAANLGGFKIYAMWAVTTAFASNSRGFFGMTDRATSTLTIDPSTAGDGFFGVGADAADTNWQMMRGTSGGGNFTKVDTGIPKTSAAGIYTLATYCTPNSSSMLIKFSYWANGGTTVTIGTGANDTSYTTNLPGAASALQAIYNLSSAGNQPTVDFIYSRVVIPIAAVLTNTF